MKWRGLKALRFALLLLLSPSFLAAQSAVKTIEWETLRPDGEDFSVEMPRGSTSQSAVEPYHKFELSTNTYISQTADGPVFAVVTLSGIKSNPSMYSELERLNSYVDAFKRLFPARVRGNGAVAKLTLAGEKSLQGNSGREYRLTIQAAPTVGSAAPATLALSGTAQVFVTRKRFYAVVFLSTKKDDDLQESFLSSFLIPEKIAPSPTVAAQKPKPADRVKPANPDAATATGSAERAEAETAEVAPEAEANENAARPKRRGPISGGVLNGKAISLPIPEYPAVAKAAGASGTVVVRVTVDEQGNVIAAEAISGPPTLYQASVHAAQQAKFPPTLLVGEPVQVTGVITFNFVRQ